MKKRYSRLFIMVILASIILVPLPKKAEAAGFPPGVNPSNAYALDGLLDVTAAPYNADPTGAVDATAAIQNAVNDGFAYNMQVFFPAGTYKVSDTIEAYIPHGQMTEARVGNYLVGATTGSERPVIKLKDNSVGFDDVNGPYATVDGSHHIKPVIHFWREDDVDLGTEKPNESFDNVIRGIDFDLGLNPGAVAIRHQSCEGSAIEDVYINATNAFAGIFDIIGSGGSITNIEVEGGKYGVYAENSQPAPLITGIKLEQQTEAAIFYNGKSPLTVVGFHITKPAGPVITVGKQADGTESSGNISLVDGSVRLSTLQSNATIIQNTDRSVYLRNVYAINAGYIIRHSTDPSSDLSVASGDQNAWINVGEYAYDKGYTPNQTKLVDGSYVTGHTYPVSGPYYTRSGGLPTDLISRHVWAGGEKFTAFDQAGVINVKDAPYNAQGDGTTDDTAAIQSALNTGGKVFLPKGKYIISSSLILKSTSQLFGVSKTASVIAVSPTSTPAADTPIITTVNDANASPVLANVKLELPVQDQLYYAVDWKAGKNSIVKDIWVKPADIQADAPHNPSLKWVVVEGNGGGKWYNLLAIGRYGPKDNNFRIQSVEGTTQPLIFYMFHSQYARTGNNNPQAIIKDSSNVTIFSAKFESTTNNPDNQFSSALVINHSNNINIIGNSGVLKPLTGREIFKLNDTTSSTNDNTNITIANMGKNNGGSSGWDYVKEFYGGSNYNIPGNNIGTLFKRGQTTIEIPH
ncbi:glycosyl hydrolase family 28-related protein [Paenibacillus sp. BK720]|uniref:glycosyl hydrolase family 28-related protein n=1 Tax=Paenibacillus sp. BK720 TaxID=2587092 RepID=UPI001ABA4495